MTDTTSMAAMTELLMETHRNLRTRMAATEAMKRGRGDDPKPIVEVAGAMVGYAMDDGETLAEFMAWLDEKVAAVPEGSRDSIRVHLTTEPNYDDPSDPVIEVRYVRLETDEEVAARQAAWAERDAHVEEREREEFEALKAKFGTA